MARTIWKMAGAAAVLIGLPGCAALAQGGHVVTASSIDEPLEDSDYRWIDRAHALWDAIGDAPPDYRFRFAGGEPFAWETRDGFWVVAEDVPEGTRTYFFAPGERGPFLVREAERSFAFEEGHIAAVYDADGTVLPRYQSARMTDTGDDLYQRGRRLRDALQDRQSDRQWEPVDTTAWTELNLFFVGIDQRWDSGWRRNQYDAFARADQQRWAAERARRAAMANAFARWRGSNFQGPPPPGLGRRWMHGPGRPGGPPRPPIAGQPTPPPGTGWGGRPNRPDRPNGSGPRPGVPGRPQPQPPVVGTPGAPQPPAPGTPGWQRPDRPGGWQGGRPGWQGGGRPDRPTPPPGAGTPGTPPPPVPGTPGWQRPGRPDGAQGGRPGWQGGERPNRPTPPPAAAPAPQPAPPAAERPPQTERRGNWMTPNWLRNAAPATPAAPQPRPERPRFDPPAAARPSFTPPPPRSEPAARPAPPPRPEPAARPAPPPRSEPAARPAPPPRPAGSPRMERQPE